MTTDIKSFFKNILPVPSDRVQSIFNRLKETGYYRSDTWKDLPTTTKHTGDESTIYDPFVEIANKINEFALIEGWVQRGEQIRGRWVNCNSEIPSSQETIKTKIRPDCALVSTETDKDILLHWKEHSMITRADAAEEAPVDKALRWLQMLLVVEIKKEATVDTMEKALEQLCCYAREIFRHQSDRRFVIGLTLCANKLRIYLFDRSGVLGIDEDIDINKKPSLFVQTLSAFSLLHFEDMGWDRTMKLYYNELQTPSFAFPWRKVETSKTFTPQWVIEVNKVDYVTIRTLSTIHAQVMCGRATLVWEVCKLSDFKGKNAENVEILVLKQSWQRISGQSPAPDLETVPLEEFVYKKAGIASGRFRGAEYVRTRDGSIVSTKSSIRKNLQTNAKPTKSFGGPTQTAKASKAGQTSKGSKTSTKNVAVDDPFAHVSPSGMSSSKAQEHIWEAQKDRVFGERRLTRILMERRGHKLVHFASFEEFVLTLKNAVKIHKDCYDAGILHRDISPNNIVIRHRSQQTVDERGDLIDFDHAKLTEIFKSWIDIRTWVVPKDLKKWSLRVQNVIGEDIPLSLRAIQKIVTDNSDPGATSFYITTMKERFPSRFPSHEDARELELEDIGLGEPNPRIPFFSPDDVGPGQRTGTPAYTSHQFSQSVNIVHDAVHDMESLLWVIIQFALTQRGPGNVQRLKLDLMAGLVYDFFDSPGSERFKAIVFPSIKYSPALKTLEDILIARFHPNFRNLEPFKNLVVEWWKTIYTALQYGGFELANIHYHIGLILEKTREDLRKITLPEDVKKLTERELIRRERLEEAIKIAFREQRMVLPGDVVEEDIPGNDPDDIDKETPQDDKNETPQDDIEETLPDGLKSLDIDGDESESDVDYY